MAIAIVLIVFLLATLFIDKKVFPKIYAETSVNPFNFFHKVICVVMGASIFLLIPFEGELPEMFWVGILIEVVAIGLFAALNIRYKTPKTIAIVTAINAVYGIAFSARFLLWILSFALNMGGLVLGQDWKFGSSFKLFGGVKLNEPETISGSNVVENINNDYQRMQDNAKAADEAAKERNNEAAEAYAASLGFSSADDAEDYGVKTGKQD